MIVDAVGWRMADGSAVDEAAALPGLFLAWCVNMGPHREALAESEAGAVLRLKYREITGGEFLASACGGSLDDRALSAAGLAFANAHYRDFERAVAVRTAGRLEDRWSHYDRLAPWLMERYMGQPPKARKVRRIEWRPWRWRR